MSFSNVTSRLKPTFRVPATRGRMGNTNYYTATLPFGAVVKLFTFDPGPNARVDAGEQEPTSAQLQEDP